MSDVERYSVTCPCCAAALFVTDRPGRRGSPLNPDAVCCPGCGWEFVTFGGRELEDDGELEGEGELEIDADGDCVVSDDEATFPAWHGMNSAFAERRFRGMRDIGEWVDHEAEEYEEEVTVWRAAASLRCLCPSCGHRFRDVGFAQLWCPDCHFPFSFQNDDAFNERDHDDWDDMGFPHDIPNDPRPDAAPIIVCPIGSGHVRTVQQALTMPIAGRPIHLRPGLHESWGFMAEPMHIVGVGPRADIIVQTRNASLQVNHPLALLANVTVQGLGRMNKRAHVPILLRAGVVQDCDITSDSVACVDMDGGTLRACRIHDSESIGVMAGSGDIEDCEVHHNAGSGISIQAGAVTVLRCRVHHGFSDGIRIATDATGVLIDCDVHDNARTGVRVGGPRCQLSRCRLHSNNRYGLAVALYGAAELRDCEIFANSGTGLRNHGGGMHVFDTVIREGHGAAVATRGSAVTVLRRCEICCNRLGCVRRPARSRKPVLSRCRIFANGPTILPRD